MGMLLSCAREALPGAGAAFVIATVEATVSAVSEAGGADLRDRADASWARPSLDLLASPMGEDQLLRTVTQAAHPGARARGHAGARARHANAEGWA